MIRLRTIFHDSTLRLRTGFVPMLACMLLTVLVGCADAPRPRMDRAAELPPPSADTMAGNDAQKSFEAPPPPRIPPTIRIGTGQTINTEAAAAPSPGTGGAGGGETTFNFEGESLNAVVKAILGDLLQKNYVIAPGVQGTVTLSTPSPVNANQALSLLEMVLGWNNARLIWADGRYNIVPSDQAVPGNLAPHTGSAAGARGYEVRAVPLHFISANEMQKLLVPYARPNAIVSVDPARNLIVLAGTSDELNNYLRTVQIFDVDWLAGMSVGVFPLQQTDAAHIVTQLEQAFGEHSKTPVAGMFRFMPLEGINAVLVITPQPKYLSDMQTWIDRLDQGDGQTPRLYVYDVKNVKATDLSTQLGTLYGNAAPQQASSPSTMPGLDPVEVSTYDQDKQGSAPTPAPAAQGARNSGAASAAAAAQGQASGVSITAVEDSNSLLVRATPLQWESIRRAIDRLDTMPLQVHIEAQVVEVKLTGDLSYGVSWYFQNAIPDPTLRGIAANRHGFGPIAGSILPSTDPTAPGASWTFLGHNSLAVIQALDAVTNVRVLSAPSLVVRNNVEADFDSGTQIPVASTIFNPISGSSTSPTPTDPATLDTYSQVQFRQTGVSLKVKPRVSTNGMVFMDITQDVSSPSSTGPTIAGNISVDNRKLKTSVAVPSGETVVLAGLIKETDGVGRNGIPYLSRIPVIGGLFGTQSKNKEREEVLVLITPTVIRDPSDLRKLTDEYGSRFQGLDPLRLPPKGK